MLIHVNHSTILGNLCDANSPNTLDLPSNICSLSNFSTADNWIASSTVGPTAFHAAYYHKGKEVQIGVEFESNLRGRESSVSLGYQVDLPAANVVFKGMWLVESLRVILDVESFQLNNDIHSILVIYNHEHLLSLSSFFSPESWWVSCRHACLAHIT